MACQLRRTPVTRRDFATLRHEGESAAPAGFRKEVDNDIGKLFDLVQKRIPQVFVRVSNIRPVDDKGSSDNILSGNESPITAVRTVVPIITHRKIAIGRHDNFCALSVLLEVKITVEDIFVLLVIREPINLVFQERKAVTDWQIAPICRFVKNVRLLRAGFH